jgi:hypothetical protein
MRYRFLQHHWIDNEDEMSGSSVAILIGAGLVMSRAA